MADTPSQVMTPLQAGARVIVQQRDEELSRIRRAHAVAERILRETDESGISFDTMKERIDAETGIGPQEAAYYADELRSHGLARIDRKSAPFMMYRTDL